MTADGPAAVASPGVVDSHVHLLPGRLAEKVRAFFLQFGTVDLAYPLDHEVIGERLAAEGIDTVWSLPYAHRAGVAAWLNEESVATIGRGSAVSVIGGATVHPADDDPVGIVRTGVEDGGLRVLKLHCAVGAFDPTDPRLTPVWDYAERIALPVVVHAGHTVDGQTDAAALRPIDELARRHPEARVIIAHCGHQAVREALALVDRHPNVHADLTPVMYETVAVPAEAAGRLSHKLLFGTDTPNTPLTATRCLEHLDSLALTTEQRVAITGGNARRLVAAVGTGAG